MQTLAPQSPSQYLKSAYLNSAKANPRFTMRAFAKKLGLSPGGLSQILAAKKKLSFDRAFIISEKLGLSATDRDYFLLLVQKELAGVSALAAEIESKLRAQHGYQGTSLALEQFQLISEWYGLAILEMITHFASNWTVFQMAKHLGISHAEAQSAVDRLERLQLIVKKPDATFQRNFDRLLVDSQTPSEAIRNYYSGVLNEAKGSIQTQTPKQKVVGTEVFAFDVDQIEDVRQITENYLHQLNELAQKGKTRDQVYQAFVDVFCLGTPKREAKANKSRKGALNTGAAGTVGAKNKMNTVSLKTRGEKDVEL